MVTDVKIPNKSCRLAELIGIIIGDGYMNKYGYKYFLQIAGNKDHDYQYHKNYVTKLIYELFNKEPSLIKRYDQNTLYTQLISKSIVQFLGKTGIPYGKKNFLNIPEWIISNNNFSKAFIRGYFDTDGSLILRKRKQNSISFASKNQELIVDLNQILKKLGYFTCFNKEERYDKRGFHSIMYHLRINRKKEILKFIEEIGSSNPYKIQKMKKLHKEMGPLGFEPRI